MRNEKRKGFMNNKGFTFRSGPVKKTNSYSSFWDNNVDDVDTNDDENNDDDNHDNM